MNGKGGFLRILEAFIAIAIIAGVMSFLYVSQIQKPNQEESIRKTMRIILEKIQAEEPLREAVQNELTPTLETEIDQFIPPEGGLLYRFSICPINEICSCDGDDDGAIGGSRSDGGLVRCPINKDVFSDEISVSVTLDQSDTAVNPEVIRLFVWEN